MASPFAFRVIPLFVLHQADCKVKIFCKICETFSVLIRLISERGDNYPFRKGESQWTTVQVATAVSLMVMTKG